MNRSDLQNMAQRERERQEAFRCRLLCCASTPCLSSGGTAVSEALQKAIKERGWMLKSRWSLPAAWDLVAAARWSRCSNPAKKM